MKKLVVLLVIVNVVLTGSLLNLKGDLHETERLASAKQIEVYMLNDQVNELKGDLEKYKQIYFENLRESDPLISQVLKRRLR